MKPDTPVLRSVRLLDQLRERIRYLHYSLSTEKAYVYWVRFFHSVARAGRCHSASARDGRARGGSLPEHAGDGTSCVGVHTQSGAQRLAVFVP